MEPTDFYNKNRSSEDKIDAFWKLPEVGQILYVAERILQ